MKRSTDRILTTHAGSLPRPSALQDGIRTLLEGQPFDEAALASQVKSAVSQAVRQQADAGVDIEFGWRPHRQQTAFRLTVRLQDAGKRGAVTAPRE